MDRDTQNYIDKKFEEIKSDIRKSTIIIMATILLASENMSEDKAARTAQNGYQSLKNKV